jgi:hypothetical protein
VRGRAAVRERTCPGCSRRVVARTARWCGTCGALLVEPPPPRVEPGSPRRRRYLVALAAALGVASVVVASEAVVDRAAPSEAVHDVAVRTPDADLVSRLERRTPPPVPAVTEPTCAEVADRSCFLWVVAAGTSGVEEITVTDELLLSEEARDGLLVARALRDGSTVWTADVPRSSSSGVLSVVDDLIVHVEGGELTGREVATGEERWRTDALGRFAPFQIGSADGVLVVAGEHASATSYGRRSPSAVAAGFDPVTGELHWYHEGDTVSLAAGGLTVIGAFGEPVRAYGPAGDLRWQRDDLLPDEESGLWASGHVVTVHDRHGRSQLHRLRDGAPLGIDGYVLADDGRHSFAELSRTDAIGRSTGQLTFVLLDDDGVVWEADGSAVDSSGCLERVELERDVIRVTTCGGTVVDLARADGTEVARAATTAPRNVHGNVLVNVLALHHDDPSSAGGVEVVDLRTDSLVATLPHETQHVWRHDRWGRVDLGGFMVLQSRGWLSALPLPSEPDPEDTAQ